MFEIHSIILLMFLSHIYLPLYRLIFPLNRNSCKVSSFCTKMSSVISQDCEYVHEVRSKCVRINQLSTFFLTIQLSHLSNSCLCGKIRNSCFFINAKYSTTHALYRFKFSFFCTCWRITSWKRIFNSVIPHSLAQILSLKERKFWHKWEDLIWPIQNIRK